MNNGALVISLDFELYWGISSRIRYHERKEYFDTTLKLIPELLKIFELYQVKATWATVGMLRNSNWDEWELNNDSLKHKPEYHDVKLNNHYNVEDIIVEDRNPDHFFAGTTIDQIRSTSGQEVGCHTYSHYFCHDAQNLNQSLSEDLKLAHKLAKIDGDNLRSIVLPRNQIDDKLIGLLKDQEYETIRANPDVWYWKRKYMNTVFAKIARLVDSYTSLFRTKGYSWDNLSIQDGIILQPASRFLRPISKTFTTLNRARISRIKKEMRAAAKKNQIYHLWWHPHNFAVNNEQAQKDLRELLDQYKILARDYGMESLTMREIAELANRHVEI